jgi:hypothetical protein
LKNRLFLQGKDNHFFQKRRDNIILVSGSTRNLQSNFNSVYTFTIPEKMIVVYLPIIANSNGQGEFFCETHCVYHVDYIPLRKNMINMNTLVVGKKRKNIDIPMDTFRNLSIRAASEGRSLKSFIENLLVMESNSISDEELFGYLVKNKPQGDVYLNETEQNEFENWLGI